MSRHVDIADRFWPKVDRRGPDECWLWTAMRSVDGYGRVQVGRRSTNAHRVAWELVNGPIPAGLHVLHRCDNPPCVNPAHLWLGTHRQNIDDAIAKGRFQHGPGLGEANGSSKLTAADVRAIRESPLSNGQLAARYGVGKTAIRQARVGLTWAHVV